MFLAEYSYGEDISAQREEAFEDGKQQGIQQSIIDTAKKMLKGKIPFRETEFIQSKYK